MDVQGINTVIELVTNIGDTIGDIESYKNYFIHVVLDIYCVCD